MDSGSNSNNGLTSGAPFATLAYAVSQADDGTGVTINVGAGTYTEEDLTISKSNIKIKGAGAGSTIFDGDLDIKVLQHTFLPALGVGQTSIGFIQLDGKNVNVSSSTTSTIIELPLVVVVVLLLL